MKTLNQIKRIGWDFLDNVLCWFRVIILSFKSIKLYWKSIGLICVDFTFKSVCISLHILIKYKDRKYWKKFGYEKDWYDGPIYSFFFGPLGAVCVGGSSEISPHSNFLMAISDIKHINEDMLKDILIFKLSTQCEDWVPWDIWGYRKTEVMFLDSLSHVIIKGVGNPETWELKIYNGNEYIKYTKNDMEINFKNKAIHGKCNMFHRNGRKMYRAEFENGLTNDYIYYDMFGFKRRLMPWLF